MKTIKIIGLIPMIYNDEELPKEVIYRGETYYLVKDSFVTDYKSNKSKYLFSEILSIRHINDFLDTELVIEEEKEIKKLDISGRRESEYCNPLTVEIMAKLNEVIEAVNEINKDN